jgi:hypothetical protein
MYPPPAYSPFPLPIFIIQKSCNWVLTTILFILLCERLLSVDVKDCLFTILIGNAEDEEAPRKRRKDFSNDSSKSANRSNRKESDREETVKWESDVQAGFIVGSPDGELTVFFKIQNIFGMINCRLVVSWAFN